MKQLTQSEIRKNGKVYKNVSSPETSGTMKQVTDIVEKDGTFSISTDGGKTYSPAVPVTSVNGQTGAVTIAVPTKTSELTNDSGFITASDIPTIPTKTSQLTNDSGFVTNSAIGKGTLTIQKNGANVATFGANQSENATANISVPTKTSDLTNDSGFVTSADVPSKTSDLTNDSGFLTKNNIVAGDNVTVTDENGNVKISATGGGSGGSVTYTKLVGSVNFTVTPYTNDPYFLDQNAATWSENSAVGDKALTSTTDIGLFIGTSYTMVVNIQGTSTLFSAEAEDGGSYGLQGSKVLWFKRDGIYSQFFIYDHCTIVGDNIQAGNGCIFAANLGSDITIANINYFSGNRGVIPPVTITNSAIKINSAVTMYINSSLVVSGTKTDGSITLTAGTEGSVSYEMEILDTPTEGLFEIVNAYVPTVPTKTSQLVNDNGFITASNIPTIPTKTSQLTNDSGFATTADIPTKTSQLQNDSGFVSVGEWKEWTNTSVLTEEGLYEIVTTEYPNDGNKTFFVQYEQGKPNNGACWVSVLTAGSVTVVSPICSGDGTLRVDRSGSGSSTTEPLPFKYRKITN